MPYHNLALIAVFAVCTVLSAIFCFDRLCGMIRNPQAVAEHLPERIRRSRPILLPLILILDIGAAAGWAFIVFSSMAFIARLGMA